MILNIMCFLPACHAGFDAKFLTSLVKPGGLIADLKGMWREVDLGPDVKRLEI